MSYESKDEMKQSNTIKEIPKTERPYEKCERRGVHALSDEELLAVLLRTGTQGENALELSRRILYHAGETGILGLHQFSMERLMGIKGIGKVKAIQISCISELAALQGILSGSLVFCGTGVDCQILYGRHASREAGAYEASDVEYESKAGRRDECIEGDGERLADHAERAFYRSVTEECSVHRDYASPPKRRPDPEPGRYADNQTNPGCRSLDWY